jgi:hypothetical protein
LAEHRDVQRAIAASFSDSPAFAALALHESRQAPCRPASRNLRDEHRLGGDDGPSRVCKSASCASMRSPTMVWSPDVAQPPLRSARAHKRAKVVRTLATQTRSTLTPRSTAFASQPAKPFVARPAALRLRAAQRCAGLAADASAHVSARTIVIVKKATAAEGRGMPVSFRRLNQYRHRSIPP